jgi:hypothetical protein
MRAAAVAQEVADAAKRVEHFAAYHSETVPWLLAKLPWLPGERTEVDDSARLCASGAVDAALQLAATAFLVVAVPATAVFALLALLLLPSLAAYPIVQPILLAARGHPLPPLATTLSACYLACLVGLATLAPAVRRFQAVRGDLVSARGFPPAFYSEAVVAVLRARCEAAVRAAHACAQRGGMAPPQLRFGDDCSICLGKIEKGQRVAELGCGHSFHRDCIQEWLGERSACPNCRKPADLRVALDEAAQQEERALQRELRQREMRALELAGEGVEGY